jgi:hypothetical protein
MYPLPSLAAAAHAGGGGLLYGARAHELLAAMARLSAAGPRWATAGRAGAGGADWVGPLARPNPVG